MEDSIKSSETLIMEYFCERFSKIPVVYLDNKGMVKDSNTWFMRMCGLQEQAYGKMLEDYIEIADKPAYSPVYEQASDIVTAKQFTAKPRNKQPVIDYQGIAIRSGDKQMLFFRNKLDETDKVLETVTELNIEISALARDLSKKNQQLTRANERITELLDSDTLTGVKNRRYISNAIDQMISFSDRHNLSGFCLIMFDIDHFKKANDQFGHDLGDQVLIEVTRLFSQQLRKEDTLARFGGEEFIILLVNQDLVASAVVAEKLRSVLENREMPHGKRVTASFGVSQYHPGSSKEELLKTADEAMYAAKRSGRNRVVLETDAIMSDFEQQAGN